MESLLKLPVATGNTARILQITDTYLFADKRESLLGINTYRSYHAVLDAIQIQRRELDLIVATGDLAQDHSLAAYQHFAEGIFRLPVPCVWLPGNHDYHPSMVDALTASGIAPSKQVLLGDRDSWQIILLDSQVYGVSYRKLSEYHLEWMARCLQAHPERYTLLLLHHHPIPCGCTWLDQHSLRNPHMLVTILLRYPKMITLVCGHIHQDLDLEWQGRCLLTTPSTCVHFKPHSAHFSINDVSPGWRYLDLMPDGCVETQVYRLENNDFRPDIDSDGY